MGFLIYNDKALFLLLGSVAIGLGVGSFTGRADPALLAGGLTAICGDFYMRLRHGESSPALIHPDAGAHLWFMPVWIIGLVALIYAGVQYTGLMS